MQAASFWNRTLVDDSIFYDDNMYTSQANFNKVDRWI